MYISGPSLVGDEAKLKMRKEEGNVSNYIYNQFYILVHILLFDTLELWLRENPVKNIV